MTNSPLVCITFKKILVIISTSTFGTKRCILDTLASAMLWCQDAKAGMKICSGFTFQWFKIIFRIRLCMIMCLSLEMKHGQLPACQQGS